MVYRVFQISAPSPMPGRNEKCTMKTEDSIFRYNIFKNYLERFGSSALNDDPFFGEIIESPLFYQFLPKTNLQTAKNRHDERKMMVS